jgi:hypothetical protein
LGSKSLNDFNVVSFITIFGKDNPFGFKFIVFSFDGFADFVNSLGEKRVVIGSLNNSLEGSFVINSLNLGHGYGKL